MGSIVGTIAFSDDCVLWTIPDFFCMPQNTGHYMRSPRFGFADKIWQMRIFPKGWFSHDTGWFGLRLDNCDSDSDESISVRVGLRGKLEEDVLEFNAEPNDEYEYFEALRVIRYDELVSRRRELLPGGVLNIYCKIIKENDTGADLSSQYEVLSDVAEPGNICAVNSEDVEEKQDLKSKSIDRLQQDFKELLLSGRNSDVTLRVRGTEFKVHGGILSARSPVFSAMFQHDMAEKATGVVDIEDSDPDAFPDFLQYLYTGRVENMSSEKVLELYAAADKYQICELREECLDFMMVNMTVENICDFLTLSLRHQEKKLTEKATRFFLQNGREIVVTAKWQTFLSENTVAGNELFIKFIGA